MCGIFRKHMKKEINTLLSHTKQEGSCLIWTKCFNSDGYARALIEGNANTKVHRVVWELYQNKSVPKGMCVRHSCDNPKCINPQHLLLGTFAENGQDKVDRNRQPRVVTKDIVFFVNDAFKTLPSLSRKQLAEIAGIDSRRVSDILTGKYCSATGKFLGHGKRRF